MKPGLRPVPAFAGIHIEFFIVKVQLFGKVVGEPAFPHEPADVLNGGHAIQPVAGKPAVRGDFDHGGGVAYQLDGIVVKDPDIRCGVLVAIVGFCGVTHVQSLFLLFLVPLDKYILSYLYVYVKC